MDRYELAWAAGFFDGEGWAASPRFGRGEKRRPMARVNQADASGVPEVLERFRRALGGVGRITGPVVLDGRKDLYAWQVSSAGDVDLVHHLLMPWLGQVKLLAFANALGRASARSRPATKNDEWRAWAAGFYDGEGSAYLMDHRSHEGYAIGEITITQSSGGGMPEVLVRLATVFGLGHLNGPYVQEHANLAIYRLKISAQDEITPAIEAIWPWLGAAKQRQARTVIDTLRAQERLPRGNPAWGNDKTHCVNGHEYATARIRPFVPRKGGEEPRASSSCLACLREYARSRRAAKKDRPAVDDDRRSISEHGSPYLLK